MTNKPEKWTLTYNGKKISSKEEWLSFTFSNNILYYKLEHEKVAITISALLKCSDYAFAHMYSVENGFDLISNAKLDSIGVIFRLHKVIPLPSYADYYYRPVILGAEHGVTFPPRQSRISILRELFNNVASSIGNAIDNLLGE